MRLIKFYKLDCGPCRLMAPVAEKISKKYDLHLEEVNVTEFPGLADKYEVYVVPTLMTLDENDEEINRHTGMNTQRAVEGSLKFDNREDT